MESHNHKSAKKKHFAKKNFKHKDHGKAKFHDINNSSNNRNHVNNRNELKKKEKPAIHQSMAKPATTSVYKRTATYPKCLTRPLKTNYFVTERDPRFNEVLQGPYEGFHMEVLGQYPQSVSDQYQQALVALDNDGLYQFDMTQPAGLGTKVARTFVSRCLVGDAGMTYKYLGLRMFAHPWNQGEVGSSAATVSIGQLNSIVTQRAQALNAASASARTFPLKKEPLFGRDLCSVSWHADSSLDHYSAIAVYHFEQLAPESPPTQTGDWRVALRVQVNAEGPQQGRPAPVSLPACQTPEQLELQPPICLTLPKECIYYMLDDFNHHHQHAVLAGHTHRYASTHRVSRVEGHSYAYIHQRAVNLLGEKLSADVSSIRKTILLAEEVEFEWLRQYYIQGEKHHQLHTWWHAPMQTLLEQLSDIELRIIKQFSALIVRKKGIVFKKDGVNTTKQEKKTEQLALSVTAECYVEMANALQERWEKRKLWLEREKDPIYDRMEDDLKPKALSIEQIDARWQQIHPQIFVPNNRWQEEALILLRS